MENNLTSSKIPFEFQLGSLRVSGDNQLLAVMAHHLQPIAHFWENPNITSIAINRFDDIWIREQGVWHKTEAKFAKEEGVNDLIKQVVRSLGQEIDGDTAPLSDSRLADGTRINAVLPPITPSGTVLTIRLFPKARFSLDNLIEKGVLNNDMAEFLRLAARCEYCTFISGATGSGKTTILNALASLIPETVRIGVYEDTSELRINHSHVIYHEASSRSIKRKDGSQVVTLSSLIENCLRQEMSAVIVGEIRKPEAATALMLALNTGHRNVYATVHANNTKAAVRRMVNMLLSNDTRIPYEACLEEVTQNFDLIIQTEHTPLDGKRIVEIAEFQDGVLVPLFKWDYINRTHTRLDVKSRLDELIKKYGL